MKFAFDNVDIVMFLQDAWCHGWRNLERYSYWGRRKDLGPRRGAARLSWNPVEIQLRDRMSGSPDFFGRLVPWWVTGLTSSEVVAHVRKQVKKLPKGCGGCVYVWWCQTYAVGSQTTHQYHVALAWSPEADIEGINSMTLPEWAEKLRASGP